MAYLPMCESVGGSIRTPVTDLTIVSNRVAILENGSYVENDICHIDLLYEILNINNLNPITKAVFPDTYAWDSIKGFPNPAKRVQHYVLSTFARIGGISSGRYSLTDVHFCGTTLYWPASSTAPNDSTLATTFFHDFDMGTEHPRWVVCVNMSYAIDTE